MALTYEPISTTVFAVNTTDLTLSSIPQTYTDLRLVIVGQAYSGTNPVVKFNAITTGWNQMSMFRNDAGNTIGAFTTGTSGGGYGVSASYGNWRSGTEGMICMEIMDYTSSNPKGLICSWGQATGDASRETHWDLAGQQNTGAITSIVMTAFNWQAGSILTLFGIKRA